MMEGHTNFVRPLCWHNEIPWILLSGGWDSNIKIWNTTNSVCLQTLIDHHSDIYAIASHQSKPNLFITGSRDNSLRMWEFRDLHHKAEVFLLLIQSELFF